jgi:predicted Zn finger-like uncharacterized protein
MIIQCQGCDAKYFLSEDKVPENPIKVRCPKCTAVFTLTPQPVPVTAGAPSPGVQQAPARPPHAAPVPETDSHTATPAQPETPPAAPARAEAAPPKADAPTTSPEATAGKPEPKRKKGKKGGRSDDARAKRLARVLVSDILCYNQEKRDQALQDGTLMTVLGEEIKKSWEMYKDKVGPEMASSTEYFKEALNEILADGQEVF